VCNLGEMLRLDGEKLTSVFALRRLLREVDRTLDLDPNHVDAMATKGTLLLRLPRMLGGDPKEGERLLREVVKRDDSAVTSRITLAKTCVERGQRDEAIQLASRARQIAQQEGRADKVAEAQATLDELGAGAQ
jgi:cytochrome c-type biogenesis protein CcmH/NrfG